MATISGVGSLSPMAQVKQFCSALGSLLSSEICESTDTAFKRVCVRKKDEEGNIKSYNGNNGEKITDLYYIQELKTGNLYFDDPSYVVAMKCFMIFLAMPIYTAGKLMWNVFKTPVDIVAVAIDTFVNMGEKFCSLQLYEGCIEIKEGCVQIIKTLGSGLFEIIKAPIFGFGAELAALYGIFKPYHGRKMEGMVENAWQAGASYKGNCQSSPRGNESCWKAFLKEMRSATPTYLAQCFQVRGNIHDERIILVQDTVETTPGSIGDRSMGLPGSLSSASL